MFADIDDQPSQWPRNALPETRAVLDLLAASRTIPIDCIAVTHAVAADQQNAQLAFQLIFRLGKVTGCRMIGFPMEHGALGQQDVSWSQAGVYREPILRYLQAHPNFHLIDVQLGLFRIDSMVPERPRSRTEAEVLASRAVPMNFHPLTTRSTNNSAL